MFMNHVCEQIGKLRFYHRRRRVSTPRVEASISDYLRDFAPNLEKYKVVQIFFHVEKQEISRTMRLCLFYIRPQV